MAPVASAPAACRHLPATELLGDGAQQQNQEALITVLGICLLIIGLCAFTGAILVLQQLQQPSSRTESATVAPVRRASKPMAATTQFRPLGEGLRHRGDLTRQTSGKLDRSSSLLLTSADVTPTLNSTDVSFARSSVGNLGTTTTTPTGITSSAAAHPTTATSSSGDAALMSGCLQVTSSSIYSGTGGAHPISVTKPIDGIDIGLLSRIDEALSSGYMQPHQATQLLKSYGCDLDDLLRTELGRDSADGEDGPAAARLASAHVLGAVRPAASTAPAATTIIRTAPAASPATTLTPAAAHLSPAATAAAAAASPPPSLPSPGTATAANPLHNSLQQQQQQQSGGLQRSGSSQKSLVSGPDQPGHPLPPQQPQQQHQGGLRSQGGSAASMSSLLSTGGGGGGGGGGGHISGGDGAPGSAGSAVVIDDALLLKIDLALASGCVRPDQATQLLKSYGCDLPQQLLPLLGCLHITAVIT
ncbi:hypothetical protein VOLCADRAFT_90885 [Volvox carteri f. nagariensis]|uniref:Uncharacterized protein n=1 Tax=Volvox carteri f. nagariensis TaxID=3068 RepID=D8TVB6_VOLCA|nr:uncharacterized protein VOLCADRAFT_90885 [Volvox carteri f. nagariensis]EFJ48673.1 hypothetical protein VOLCADRAFT_90885 [Volvox carteri f. nagariensis]|eukprot:XP_002950472.1 hypothetical protein VOLCADRAFT_90885 [Volvox carteri f. nagariensis]